MKKSAPIIAGVLLVIALIGNMIGGPQETQSSQEPVSVSSLSSLSPSEVAVSNPDLAVSQEPSLEHEDRGLPDSGDVPSAPPPVVSEESSFEVHFIDVGQADAALVVCDGRTMLIDGGNVSDSSRIVAYLKKLGITHLDYIVSTHPHEDHVGGLSGALNVCSVGVVYSSTLWYSSSAFNDFAKYVELKGLEMVVPRAGDSFSLGSSKVEILAPNRVYDDVNNSSIVLHITYVSTSFLFMGDAERESEQDLLGGEYPLASTVLKVGHHGSASSTSYAFLREVMPEFAVISVGKDNEYGHPTEEVLSRLRDADVKLYRTDIQGDIIAESDGERVVFTTTKNLSVQTNPTAHPVDEESYIGNLNSLKFHLPSCKSLPEEKNRIYLDTREKAVEGGYVPCGVCKP